MACDILSFLLLPVIPIYRPQPKRGSSISKSVWTLWFWGLMEQIKIPHCFKLEHYSYRCWLLLLMVKIFFRSKISFSSIIIKCTLVGWQVYYWHVSIMLNGVKQDFVFPRISVWTFTCRIPFCTLVMCCCILLTWFLFIRLSPVRLIIREHPLYSWSSAGMSFCYQLLLFEWRSPATHGGSKVTSDLKAQL